MCEVRQSSTYLIENHHDPQGIGLSIPAAWKQAWLKGTWSLCWSGVKWMQWRGGVSFRSSFRWWDFLQWCKLYVVLAFCHLLSYATESFIPKRGCCQGHDSLPNNMGKLWSKQSESNANPLIEGNACLAGLRHFQRRTESSWLWDSWTTGSAWDWDWLVSPWCRQAKQSWQKQTSPTLSIKETSLSAKDLPLSI